MGLAVRVDELEDDSPQARVEKLSEGQLDVLWRVADHRSSKEIAVELDISPHTVDQRVRQSLQILGVTRRQDAARMVVTVKGPSQRLIHQTPYIPPAAELGQSDPAIGKQIRHADRAGRAGSVGLQTEQSSVGVRPSLSLPFATGRQPRNEMSVAMRLLWIVLIAMGSLFAAGMYLAGLESLARLLNG